MKTLISAQPTVWDVTNKYLKQSNEVQLKALRRVKQNILPNRKELIVEHSGIKVKFTLDKDGEYYDKHDMSLTKQLELLASIGNSKVTIYEGKGN